MSEQKPEPVSGDTGTGSIDPGPGASAASQAAPEQSTSNSVNCAAAKLASETAGSAEAAKDAPKEAPKAEAPKTDAPRATGKIMIMSPSRDDAFEDSWSRDEQKPSSDQDARASSLLGKRRLAALAAVIALAAVSGAIGGALAMAGLAHFNGDEAKTASVQNSAVDDQIMRIDAELAALKKLDAALSAKVNDRIDKVEKAQVEPAARLAKLSETVEKLRLAPLPVPVPAPVASIAAPKETTGSIQPPVPTPAPKPEIARLPTVEGWVLRDVAHGGAMIEGRQGLYEVFAGDPVPGLGRVDAIRRQDGRWVVVTSKGLIVAR